MRNRALLSYVGPKTPNLAYKLEEFVSLAEVAGFEVVDLITQFGRADTRFYLGPGKAEAVAAKDFDVFIAYHSLTPLQVFNLERLFKRRALDRVLVILMIFEKRAGSIESKLQIELARLRYELPKVKEYLRRAKMGEQLGFMGAGEYIVDAYYRHMVKRISTIRRKLEEVRRSRVMHIAKRKEAGVPEVVITGYTSAGKTTLFNRLVGEDKLVDGKPFATLETYSRSLDLWGKRVVVTDTIGFIDDLPPLLVESFHSTLQEIIDADVILLVVDGSEPREEISRKIETSVATLGEVGISRDRVIPVVNKVDKIGVAEVKNLRGIVGRYFSWFIPVSALTGFGIEALKAVLFFKTPGYQISRTASAEGARGLRVGDVTFVATRPAPLCGSRSPRGSSGPARGDDAR
ncbi:GTPase HflX [Pyrobaculum neutrophilum]|uniref:GTPase HflX n=1 Tax=Pyrobaculum neutrophilum (strain DSM 2338 / JCM 9278 / NBRC 100436 / V24Sta) TaxID=444157 RepID=B1YA17_PYRNV|nr:GTPase HflX [Pyrobaculum neutrophilum]ACB38991.1 GTP-binding proten HflX [Pyrobaculum neutrophilum V24Sta]